MTCASVLSLFIGVLSTPLFGKSGMIQFPATNILASSANVKSSALSHCRCHLFAILLYDPQAWHSSILNVLPKHSQSNNSGAITAVGFFIDGARPRLSLPYVLSTSFTPVQYTFGPDEKWTTVDNNDPPKARFSDQVLMKLPVLRTMWFYV